MISVTRLNQYETKSNMKNKNFEIQKNKIKITKNLYVQKKNFNILYHKLKNLYALIFSNTNVGFDQQFTLTNSIIHLPSVAPPNEYGEEIKKSKGKEGEKIKEFTRKQCTLINLI